MATLAVLLPLTSKSDVISASQQPEGAMVMTEHSSSDGSFLPPSFLQFLHFPSPPFLLPCLASLLGGQASRTRRKNKPRKVRSGWVKRGSRGGKQSRRKEGDDVLFFPSTATLTLFSLSVFLKRVKNEQKKRQKNTISCSNCHSTSNICYFNPHYHPTRKRNPSRFIYWEIIWQVPMSQLLMNIKWMFPIFSWDWLNNIWTVNLNINVVTENHHL